MMQYFLLFNLLSPYSPYGCGALPAGLQIIPGHDIYFLMTFVTVGIICEVRETTPS